MTTPIYNLVKETPSAESLWNGSHKIPWNDPEFSARILREHLSQDHHLASRKADIIAAQVEWIQTTLIQSSPSSLLDLGCGPGLYAEPLSGSEHPYLGIDFSPASIEYASRTYEAANREFRLGDVTQADFRGPHDIVMMLYGELNVFSPANCRRILSKGYAALKPGGILLVEFQNPESVKAVGEMPNSWTKADQGGLFSDTPYVCLTESHWFEEEATALQCFHVVETNGESKTYRSTTKAWSLDEMKELLQEAGFINPSKHEDWPVQDESLLLFSATKPE